MNKIIEMIKGAAAGIALASILLVGLAPVAAHAADSYSISGTSGKVIAGTTTNAIQNWPSAIGSNSVINTVDVTNVTRLQYLGSGKDFSFEFVGVLTNGTGGSGSTSNIVLRLAYEDKDPKVSTLTATNGTAANIYPALWSWSIPATVTAGNVTIDVVTNLNNSVAPPAPSTTHRSWYLYDVQFVAVTNGTPVLTNWAFYYNSK